MIFSFLCIFFVNVEAIAELFWRAKRAQKHIFHLILAPEEIQKARNENLYKTPNLSDGRLS